MIRHALSEGWLLLRQRSLVSSVLALALAVPLSIAGISFAVSRWLQPLVEASRQQTTVAVLLHPRTRPVFWLMLNALFAPVRYPFRFLSSR